MDFTQMPRSGWIWTGEEDAALNPRAQLVCFRRELTLDRLPERLTVRVSADSRYKLYVNGRLAEVGPEKGDNQVWYYETVDLRPYLRVGQNVLAALVLRYPMIHQRGNHGIWRTEYPGFFLRGDLAFDDGSGEELLADETWKYRRAEHIRIVREGEFFAPLQFFEEVRGEAWTAGWTEPGYPETDWSPAVPAYAGQIPEAVSPGNLLPRPIPPLYRTQRRFTETVTVREGGHSSGDWDGLLRDDAPVTVPAESRAVVEFSAGELTTGYLSLALIGGAGARVRLLYSECYAQPPQRWNGLGQGLPIKGDRTDWRHGELYGFEDHYAPAGCGTPERPERYEPFWFRAFRYLRLEIDTGSAPLTVAGLTYQETGYPLEARTRVSTSDPTLEKVWEISLRTLRRCMHETYEDCPFYEQLQYTMDSRSQILYTYCVSADDRLARKCMEDFKRSVRYDGLLNGSYPTYGPNVIPGFSIFYILMVHDHMMYFGDRELVLDHLPVIDGILRYFDRQLDDRGLVGVNGGYLGENRYWSFIDWVEEWKVGVPPAIEQGPITMESFLYILGLTAAAELAEYIGRPETAEEYRRRAERVREAVRACCVGAGGLYQDGPGVEAYSQHCQVFAVLTDTAGREEGRRILSEVLDRPYPKCSVAMAFYLFRALEKADLYERTQPLWDLWRDMVRNQLTTCVENDTDARSDCHAWGALALYELPSVVLGVRPARPGYAEIQVRPCPGYFTHARGEVLTPRGLVKVSWRLGADGRPEVRAETEEARA